MTVEQPAIPQLRHADALAAIGNYINTVLRECGNGRTDDVITLQIPLGSLPQVTTGFVDPRPHALRQLAELVSRAADAYAADADPHREERVTASPWQPLSRPIDIKHLGKLLEELGEAVSATARVLIQGLDEPNPDGGKLNRQWHEEELADVTANMWLVQRHFGLQKRMERIMRKTKQLELWHEQL